MFQIIRTIWRKLFRVIGYNSYYKPQSRKKFEVDANFKFNQLGSNGSKVNVDKTFIPIKNNESVLIENELFKLGRQFYITSKTDNITCEQCRTKAHISSYCKENDLYVCPVCQYRNKWI